MEAQLSDEDHIIENLVLEGRQRLYEDLDFLPLRQSLYQSEKQVPEYDDDLFQNILWKRPQEIDPHACYFDPFSTQIAARQGSLPDDAFLGALMGVCLYNKYDLIENIFASRPDDFLRYGVYTCRFYVDGEWVEVVADTQLPCLMNNRTGDLQPMYGRTNLLNEMWVPMIEKAFAKAVGSYEAITTMKVQKALLHLTGGSVQQSSLRDEVVRSDSISDHSSWDLFKKRLQGNCIVLMQPEEKKGESVNIDGDNAQPTEMQEQFFIPNKMYPVIACRDVCGYELVLLHNPWFHPSYNWTGEWSNSSSDWDMYPEMQMELENDPSIPWRRRTPNGYFWMTFRHLIRHFNKMTSCQLFPNEKFNFYCVRGECRLRQAGGLLTTIRDKESVIREATASRSNALQKATASVVVDGDPSWFNNPQYRISSNAPATVFVSVIPLGNGEDGDLEHAQMSVSVLQSPKSHSSSLHVPLHLWDVSQFTVVATDRQENGPIAVKGQETSIWSINIDSKHFYHVVPSPLRRGRDGDFVLRIFSTKPVNVEPAPPIPCVVHAGEWKRLGDLDTTGGPPTIQSSDGTQKDNPKWCQNPQYHLQLVDAYGKEEVYLKVVLRKIEGKHSTRGHQKASASSDEKKAAATVGLVVCKADVLDEGSNKIKKAPRQNKLGEPILPKASSLKKHVHAEDVIDQVAAQANAPKTILRKLQLDSGGYNLTSSFSSKTEACVFYPKIPRSWLPNGLIVVPCLSERGVRCDFELEVYTSEPFTVNQLPDSFARSVAGEWAEGTSGGSHIFPATWKKNPRYTLRFHNPVTTDAPARFRITLARHGALWKSTGKKDTVGNMIGFYIFLQQGTEQTLVYESTFLPDDEVSTDASFALPQLRQGEVYIIMPCTFSDAKTGAFVLSVLSEYEFHLKKE